MSDLFGMSSAEFSECEKYRYALWRWWEYEGERETGYCMFICLNPSTADAQKDDPTIRRCIRFAQAFGYAGLCMANLFAYRSSDPRLMRLQEDPVGPDNDEWIVKLAKDAGIVIMAWGPPGSHRGRDKAVMELLEEVVPLHYLRLTKDGYPGHPLYLPKALRPVEF